MTDRPETIALHGELEGGEPCVRISKLDGNATVTVRGVTGLARITMTADELLKLIRTADRALSPSFNLPPKMTVMRYDDNARRNMIEFRTPVETTISKALGMLRGMSRDPLIEEAEKLLTRARHKVADFVDAALMEKKV